MESLFIWEVAFRSHTLGKGKFSKIHSEVSGTACPTRMLLASQTGFGSFTSGYVAKRKYESQDTTSTKGIKFQRMHICQSVIDDSIRVSRVQGAMPRLDSEQSRDKRPRQKRTCNKSHRSSALPGEQGLLALEAYLWNCSEPFQEISLAENEICVEAVWRIERVLASNRQAVPLQAGSGEDNPVSSFLRCLYNHPSYPRKTRLNMGGGTAI